MSVVKPGLNKYEVVLANKYYLRELVESISLDESLSDIAYHAQVRLLVTDEFQKIGIANGQEIRISGIPFGGSSMVYLLHPGVVWECSSETTGIKHIDIDIYDRSIYLAKSEDEYLFPAGQTATDRLKQYCKDWGITSSIIADTKIALAKGVYRAQSIYSMIQRDIQETAVKGGGLFRARMSPDGLELIELGKNKNVWVLEPDQNVSQITQKRTLEGTVTQVKVLGNAGEDSRSPVLAIEKGETAKYGTLQVVLQDEKITTASAASISAKKLLCGMQETFEVEAIDINTIRAGDKVMLSSTELYVISVNHQLGNPGKMTLELASEDYVRRRFYLEGTG
ncbi:MAG: phage portal protein [Syntrophomonadaceae bacterium]|nr:phage portal protein [Syntrophomonadaceae bacterium]